MMTKLTLWASATTSAIYKEMKSYTCTLVNTYLLTQDWFRRSTRSGRGNCPCKSEDLL